jgi:hypothetical protein
VVKLIKMHSKLLGHKFEAEGLGNATKYDSVSANRKCTSLISCSVYIFFTEMLKSLPLKILLFEILGVFCRSAVKVMADGFIC